MVDGVIQDNQNHTSYRNKTKNIPSFETETNVSNDNTKWRFVNNLIQQ